MTNRQVYVSIKSRKTWKIKFKGGINMINNIGLETAIKEIVKQAVREVLDERMGTTLVGNVPVAQEVKEEPKVEKPVVKETVEEVEGDLDSMSYNALKAMASKMGLDTTGKKVDLLERIKEALSKEDEVVDNVEETVDNEEDEEIEDEEIEDAYTSEYSDEDDEDYMDEQQKEFYDFLMELDDQDLFEIGERIGLPEPPKERYKKDVYVSLLVGNVNMLVKALEDLGYYDDEEEEETSSDLLNKLSLEELADLCTEYGVSTKGKKQALIDRLIEVMDEEDIKALFENEDTEEEVIEEDAEEEVIEDEIEDTEDENEWYTAEELAEMSLTELQEIASDLELELPYKKVGAKKSIDRAKLEEMILNYEEVEEAEEEVEEEETPVNTAREEKEEEIREQILDDYKKKKLKDTQIKKFLEKYCEGNPRVKMPTDKKDALEMYIDIKTSLVDDDGNENPMEECYVRDREYHCCGTKIVEGDKENEFYCPICGTIYEE